MLRAIIVEDEKNSQETLKLMLERYCPDIKVVAIADNYKMGIEHIETYAPQIVFLDIQMPDGNGFKMLEHFSEIDFFVIFTTAYEQYALKAIKVNAIDYILKPIVAEDLIRAVDKVKLNLTLQKEGLKNIKNVLDEIKKMQKEKKIVLSTAEGMHVVNTDDIIRCESDNYYTNFFFKDGSTMLISKTLKEHEELLSDKNFIRPHKSHLINLNYVKSYSRIDGGTIVLLNGDRIPVARRKRESMIEILHQLK
ncbi:MAG: LytTR family DNA-binding domain-containing protein [Bacteroidales bacterium]|nr:LytTR family DNA-binding domain-containing protein [Bacteroidales bacterium]